MIVDGKVTKHSWTNGPMWGTDFRVELTLEHGTSRVTFSQVGEKDLEQMIEVLRDLQSDRDAAYALYRSGGREQS